MNKLSLLAALVKDAWAKRKQRKKVGKLGLWVAGEILDSGDEYVAYITVNGKANAVLVRSASKATAISRRKLIIDTMMSASREEAQEQILRNPVQLIARTQGDVTIVNPKDH